MNSLRLFATSLTVILGLWALATTPVTAASKKVVEPPPVDSRHIIKKIDVANSTIDIENMRNKITHTYKIDSMTQVKFRNSMVTFADIKVGMLTSDELERDNDTLDALTIEEDTTPKPEKAKPKPAPKPKPTPTPAPAPTPTT